MNTIHLKLPRNLGKLLVFNLKDRNYLAYKLGQYGIYLERIRNIETVKDSLCPKLVVVRYSNNSEIYEFIKDSGLQVQRVFKSAVFPKDKVRNKGLFYSTANNLLALVKGKTLRILSKERDLQEEFYKILLEVNEEKKFNCKFDFDIFDVLVEVKKYTTPKRIWIIIVTQGLDKVLEE